MRPGPSEKRVSPVKRTGVREQGSENRQMLPGVWPGVWITLNFSAPKSTTWLSARGRSAGGMGSTLSPRKCLALDWASLIKKLSAECRQTGILKLSFTSREART